MTEQQQAQLSRCQAALQPCIEGRHEMLACLMDDLGFPNPESVREDVGKFLPAFAAWLDGQTIDTNDLGFFTLRLSVFIGEFFVQRLAGCWLLDENPQSPNFATYVVGRFTKIADPNAVVTPLRIARDYLKDLARHGPIPTPMVGTTVYVTSDGQVMRSLPSIVAEVEAALLRASGSSRT